MKSLLCIILLFLLSQPSCMVKKQTVASENTTNVPVSVNTSQTPAPTQTTSSPNENSNQNSNAANNNMFNNYLGCWYGMRGGRVKITKNKIYDLYKNRTYKYKKISKRKTDKGEEHLLECSGDFSIGFWGKYVRILFLSPTHAGITTYDSIEGYNNDHPTGEGLFDLFPCDNFFTKGALNSENKIKVFRVPTSFFNL